MGAIRRGLSNQDRKALKLPMVFMQSERHGSESAAICAAMNRKLPKRTLLLGLALLLSPLGLASCVHPRHFRHHHFHPPVPKRRFHRPRCCQLLEPMVENRCIESRPG
jgi:hypothetical protein